MKFSTVEEIDAPIHRVWGAVTDADRFERQARKRGAEVHRHPEPAQMGVGRTWTTRFDFHGHRRELVTRIASFEAPSLLVLDSGLAGVAAVARIELEAIADGRTRLGATLEMLPRSLPGRVLLQTLKLTRVSLEDRFGKGVRAFAGKIATG